MVSNSVVTSSIAYDLMYGHIDGVKLKCLNQAHNNNFLIIIPDVFVNMEVEGVNLYLPNNVLFLNDEGTQKLVKIYVTKTVTRSSKWQPLCRLKEKGRKFPALNCVNVMIISGLVLESLLSVSGRTWSLQIDMDNTYSPGHVPMYN